MGKKKGKDKKGHGAEKTALKTEKKSEKKAKKAIQDIGEEDVEALIAEFQERDRKRLQTIEEKSSPPSPRSSMTLTPNPDKDELIMFGGEYFNGSKTFLYNDLYFYNIKTTEWTLVKAPNPPAPRCSHQAVAVRQGGGQLWVFGGEFASPTQSQFYHYKDLWMFSFKDKTWEKIMAPGGPSSRSGHRMVVCKKQLIVFGGFHDNTRDCKYYNDIYSFSLETYSWLKLEVGGYGPSPRSGCQIAVSHDQEQVIVFGGYSKEKLKKDAEQGKTHTDMFMLAIDKKKSAPEGASNAPIKWKWTLVKQQGSLPKPRCSFSMTVTPGNRALMFGGVFDEEEDEEHLSGSFFNDMYSLELDKGRWHRVALRGDKENKEKKKRRKKKDPNEEAEEGMDVEEEDDEEDEDDIDEQMESRLAVTESDEQMCDKDDDTKSAADDGISTATVDPQSGTTTVNDDIFTVTVGPQGDSSDSHIVGASVDSEASGSDYFVPCPRMNPLLAVKQGVLYMYGGMFEVGDKQITLSDMYKLDLAKLDKWITLIEDTQAGQDWQESDSSDDEEGAAGGMDDDDDESDSDDDDDEDMEEETPVVKAGESDTDYFSRTKDFWMGQADSAIEDSAPEPSIKQLKKTALEMAKQHHKDAKN